jgi:hypothetical protein
MPTQPAGMMGQMTPEQAPVQPSAEPQAAAPQSGGYNGTVTLDGESFEVKGGVVQDEDGETFYISDNGEMVVDSERNIVGYVKDGEVLPLDEEHLEVLREMGVLE